MTVEVRTLRERFGLLMKKFKRDEMDSLRKSGTDEEFDEREQLLTELVELVAGAAARSEEKKEKKAKLVAQGSQLRDAAMLTLKRKRDGPAANEQTAGGDANDRSSDAMVGVGRREDHVKKRSLRSLLEERSERMVRAQEN